MKNFKLLTGYNNEPVNNDIIREHYSFDINRTEWIRDIDRLNTEILELSLNQFTGQKRAYIEFLLLIRQTENETNSR